MKKANAAVTEQVTYQELVSRFYRELTFPYWIALAEFERISKSPSLKSMGLVDRSQFSKEYLVTLVDLQSPKPSKYSLSVGKMAAERQGLSVNFRGLSKYYSEINSTGKVEFKDNSDIPTIAFANAVEDSIIDIGEADELLNAGKGRKYEHSFIIEGVENPIIGLKKKTIDDASDDYFKLLKSYFESFVKSTEDSESDFIEDELREFSRLFVPGGNVGGWNYLSSRLNVSAKDVEELYKLRATASKIICDRVIAGRDEFNLSSIGLLIAVRKYINYLKNHSAVVSAPSDKVVKGKKGSIIPKDEVTDTRNYYDCSTDDTRKHFEKLTRKNHKGVRIMTQEDIDYLLRKEFIGFDPIEEDRMLDFNGSKAVIRYHVYEFVRRECPQNLYDQYRNMLIRRFKRFRNDNPESLKSNFAHKPKKLPPNLSHR